MSPTRVVPAFDVGEVRETGPRLCLETAPLDQLELEACNEALGHRVVVGVADTAHRRSRAALLAALAERDARVLIRGRCGE
jgi:hypothetical protein